MKRKSAPPICPACRAPFIDENGRFSICESCPYRIAPKTEVEIARRNRICGADCAHKRDPIIRRGGVYTCAGCAHGRIVDEAAARSGDRLEVVYRVPKVDWKAKYLKLLREHTALLMERGK